MSNFLHTKHYKEAISDGNFFNWCRIPSDSEEDEPIYFHPDFPNHQVHKRGDGWVIRVVNHREIFTVEKRKIPDYDMLQSKDYRVIQERLSNISEIIHKNG